MDDDTPVLLWEKKPPSFQCLICTIADNTLWSLECGHVIHQLCLESFHQHVGPVGCPLRCDKQGELRLLKIPQTLKYCLQDDDDIMIQTDDPRVYKCQAHGGHSEDILHAPCGTVFCRQCVCNDKVACKDCQTDHMIHTLRKLYPI